jgi:uncharacterized protein (DUF302 family)
MPRPASKTGARLGGVAVVATLLGILALSAWYASRAWTSLDGPPLPTQGYVAMILGVVVSVGLGGGLMALVFYSSRYGYDEEANRNQSLTSDDDISRCHGTLDTTVSDARQRLPPIKGVSSGQPGSRSPSTTEVFLLQRPLESETKMPDREKASEAVEFVGVRVTHHSLLSFDRVLSNLCAQVGETTVGNIVALSTKAKSREAFEEEVQKFVGTSGFMLFAQLDHGWISKFGLKQRVIRWILGNPLIAITMMRHDLTVGLFAPVELLLIEDAGRTGCTVTYIRPSSLIAPGKNVELRKAAEALDEKFDALIASSASSPTSAIGEAA